MQAYRLTRREGTATGIALAVALFAAPARGQTPKPSPTPAPTILLQDAIDLQGRTSVILGSGARALGMGGAFLARADDATAASWNPAGLSYLRRPELSLVGARNLFNADVEGGDQSRFSGWSPDFAAVTFPVSIGNVSGAAQLSFQRVIPFDGHRDIEQNSGARVTSLDSSGGFDVIALGTGWKLTRRLRFGVTLNRWIRGYTQDLNLSVEGGRERQLMTDWRMSGWNTNLGLIFSPVESLNLGVVGKTPFTADVKLSKSRTDSLPGASGDLQPISSNAYESDQVDLHFPGAFGVGASWRAQSRLTISADYTRTFWSHAYVYNFFVLPVSTSGTSAADSSQPPRTVETYDKLPYPYVYLTAPAKQEDSEQIRVGIEYVFIGARLKVPVRAGYFNDRQILPDKDGHVPRYNGFSVGTGLIVGPVLLDLAYLYEAGSYTDTLDLNNRQRTHRFLASLIYRHGGLP